MRLPRVLLDVDGVLADFLAPSLPVLARLTGRTWAESEFKTWDIFDTVPRQYEKPFFDAVNTPGWCLNIPVFEEAVAGVARLRELADLYVVTSPMNHVPTWMFEREQWLREHFSIPHKRVVHTSAKFLCLGDILVDDKPANILAWEAEHPNGIGLLWDQPYNQNIQVRHRVTDWTQVLRVVEHLRLDAQIRSGQTW